jgi:sulfur carrier protein
MKLIVNGKAHVHKGMATLPSLLRELKVDGNHVAVMVNDDVVAKDDRSSIRLKTGDRIELLMFAGGG